MWPLSGDGGLAPLLLMPVPYWSDTARDTAYGVCFSHDLPTSMLNLATFCLTFVKGNISRIGCGQWMKDGRPCPAPYNWCLQHKEYVLFENPCTGLLSVILWTQVYYHASQKCVMLKYEEFNQFAMTFEASRQPLTLQELDPAVLSARQICEPLSSWLNNCYPVHCTKLMILQYSSN